MTLICLKKRFSLHIITSWVALSCAFEALSAFLAKVKNQVWMVDQLLEASYGGQRARGNFFVVLLVEQASTDRIRVDERLVNLRLKRRKTTKNNLFDLFGQVLRKEGLSPPNYAAVHNLCQFLQLGHASFVISVARVSVPPS